MNAFNELTDRIKKTEDIIEICRTNHKAIGLPDYISNLEFNSLKQRLEDLQRQVNEEVNTQYEELEVKLVTKDLPSGQVLVRTLTTVLGGLQSLTDSVANTLFNQASNRGPIPQEIIERNSWVLKTVNAGSFIAVVDLKHEDQLVIDDLPQRQIVSELYNLFNASYEEERLLEVISTLGTRTLKYYTDWTKGIRDSNIPVEINWVTSKTKDKYCKVSFDPEKAGKIFTILNDRLKTREEELAIVGRLTGINVRTYSFELVTTDGQKIAGRITKDKVSKSAGYLDRECRVELLKLITQSSAGNEKASWILTNVSDPI